MQHRTRVRKPVNRLGYALHESRRRAHALHVAAVHELPGDTEDVPAAQAWQRRRAVQRDIENDHGYGRNQVPAAPDGRPYPHM